MTKPLDWATRQLPKLQQGKFGSFLKYGAVGALRSVFTFSLYAVLVFSDFHPVLAYTMVFCVATPLAIVLQKKLVFKHNIAPHKLLPHYFALFGTAFVINSILLFILVEYFLIGGLIAQLICICVITILNFLVLDRFFRLSKKESETE